MIVCLTSFVEDKSGNLWVGSYGGGLAVYRADGNIEVRDSDPSTKSTYSLSQNYPNPFNPSTNITYGIAERQHVSLKIYDILGRESALLVNEEKPAGQYTVKFDATNLPNGVYFYRLQAGKNVQTKKMILLK